MIDLITGLPGNAKTLYAMQILIERASRENRPVFFAGLKGFVADDERLKGTSWTEIEPTKWMDVPPGSLIFIDECQKVFRNRSLGAQPPLHVTELEEHRHKGLDFVLLTQHPTLIDPAVRKLTQTHIHMVRIWGMEASTVHRWQGVKDNCDKPVGRKDSEKLKWKFAKDLYGIYHSADQHTFKRKIPFRAKLLLAVPVLLAAAGFFVYAKLAPKSASAQLQPVVGSTNVPVGSVPGIVSSAAIAEKSDPIADARNYIHQRTPRIVGLEHTAPRYDALTEPVRVPVPAACIQRGSLTGEGGMSCKCYTQQGTRMDVEVGMCVEFARNGYFQDFDAERDRQSTERGLQSQQVLANKVDHKPGPTVAAFAAIPDLPRIAGTSISKN